MSVAAELARVRLEPRDQGNGEGERSDTSSIGGSEIESAPTDEDPDADNEYIVDAIKWAKYRDSTRDRSDGYTGWHYGVMWNGYLKTGSETEEPLKMFRGDTRGKYPLIDEFWQALGMEIPPRQKEPMGRLGTVYECPLRLLRRWFKRNPTKRGPVPKYKRSYETYKRRRAKELQREKLERDFKPIPEDLYTKKADSDYYIWKKKAKEQTRLARLRALGVLPPTPRAPSHTSTRTPTPVAGPSQPTIPPPRASPPAVQDKGKGKAKEPSASPPPPPGKGKGKASGFGDSSSSNTSDKKAKSKAPPATTSLSSPASNLGSLFDSNDEDVEVDQVLQAASSEEEEEQIEKPVQQSSSSKRKATSPVVSTSKNDTRAEKKAKKEETIAKLAKSKIAKRVVSPPPSAPSATFGELQSGIFDAPPTPAASTPAVSDNASAPVSASTAQMQSSAPAAAAPIASAAVTASSSGPPVLSKPPLTVQNVWASLKAQQQVAPAPADAADKSPSQNNQSNGIHTQTTPTTASSVRFADAPGLPTPATPVVKSPPVTQVNPPITFDSSRHSQQTTSAGPVPQFNPAPVPSTSTGRLPSAINKPKYVQPSKIKTTDEPIKSMNQRKPPTGPKLSTQRPTPSGPASLPPRPASAYVPRPSYPSDQNESRSTIVNGNVSPKRSPVIPQTSFAPKAPMALDPRRKRATNGAASHNPLPTPITPSSPPKRVTFSLTPIDVSGGLVTFSPSLLLRNPGKFIQIMKLCMTNPHWGAYLCPAAMEFFHRSLSNNNLCPDPTTAYSVLVQFLPLDDHLRQLSGVGVTSGGGLNITVCPPNMYAHQACEEWKLWMHDILKSTEYGDLVALCEKHNSQIAGPTVNMILRENNEKKLEDLQLEDLKNMKMAKSFAKDLQGYTRFVYVGNDTRPLPIDGIEMYTADEFLRVLQQANGMNGGTH
ncbi:uncharacterized protein I303_106502 [Kwoniella dejecticola CBS 10117]|uniref:Uncharacterized protein n=1 Tax=Kwoniella dejecticola CBS 10117 TaxID=1296121 RepID=A0A1A5ZUI5_9TREE|nr:uncharacterized protein I303_08240 [Kwoniella dejecticola CBS 10117]OBR81470.1 hypothetical protein I303_08240 [Kwoniella dejecticola CBS 10117]